MALSKIRRHYERRIQAVVILQGVRSPIILDRWEKDMIRPVSKMATWAVSILIVITATLPALAGGYRSDRAHGYDDDVDCYPVTKTYDYHGRPALFGGTQCSDSYGNAWIADGSRHFIRYLGDYDGYGHRHLDRLPDDDYHDR